MTLKLLQSTLTSLLIIFALSAFSQNNNKRIEFELKDADNHKIVPIDGGVLVGYITETKAGKGMKEVIIDKFNVDLVKQNTTKFAMDKHFTIVSLTQDKQFVYLLYAACGSTNTMLTTPYFKEYSIIKFDPNTSAIQKYDGKFLKNFHFSNMKVMQGVVYLGGALGPGAAEIQRTMILSMCACYIPLIWYNPKYDPYMMSVDMNTKSPLKKDFFMSGYGKGFSKVLAFDINEEHNECNMMIKSQSKKEVKLILKDLKDNKLERDFMTKMPADKEVFSGNINTFGTKKIYAGIYGDKMKKSGSHTNSQGIVVGMTDNDKAVFNALIPYNKFKNFKFTFNARAEKIIAKKQKKGKDVTVSLSVLFHDILIREDEIVYMGEAYYPHYHTETYMDSKGNVRTRQVFDGYKFFGVLTFATDYKGALLWDNGAQIAEGPLSLELTPKFKFIEQEDESIKILYSDGNTIKSVQLHKNNKPVYGKETSIKTDKKGDKKPVAKSKKSKNDNQEDNDGTSSLEYWYDNYFIAFGEQKIKNTSKEAKEKGVKKNRQVFYLNKVEIE